MFVGGSFIEPADIAVSSSVVRIPCGRKRETDTEPAILNCSKLFSTNSIKICCRHQLNTNYNLKWQEKMLLIINRQFEMIKVAVVPHQPQTQNENVSSPSLTTEYPPSTLAPILSGGFLLQCFSKQAKSGSGEGVGTFNLRRETIAHDQIMLKGIKSYPSNQHCPSSNNPSSSCHYISVYNRLASGYHREPARMNCRSPINTITSN